MFRWLLARHETRREATLDTPSVSWPASGDVLGGRYRLEAVLGTGSAGRVYKALDLDLDLVVAVKVMRDPTRLPDVGPDVQIYAADLRAEAQAALRLSHRFIVRTFHWTRLDPFEVLIMEHVPGGTLQQRRAVRGHLPPAEAAGFLIDALEALTAAHEQGVLHNDIKPSNMLVAEGEVVRLCDFGIWSRPAVATPGQPVGTLPYMSPERLNGQAADARSDVYSAAATLFSLVSGAPPFGSGGVRTIEGHLRESRPRCSNAPPALQAVLDVAMARDPEDRYASAWAMREALLTAGFSPRADRDRAHRPTPQGGQGWLDLAAGGSASATPEGPQDARRRRVGRPVARRAAEAGPRTGALRAPPPPSASSGASPTSQVGPGGAVATTPLPSPSRPRGPTAARAPQDPAAEDAAASLEEATTAPPPGLGAWAAPARPVAGGDAAPPAAPTPARSTDASVTTLDAPSQAASANPSMNAPPMRSTSAEPRPAPTSSVEAAARWRAAEARADEVLARKRTPAAAGSPPRSAGGTPPAHPPRTAWPSGLHLIPARRVVAGARVIDVPAFFMAERPTTHREYAAYVEATGALWPSRWGGRRPKEDLADHPVVGVTLDEARSYARWRGLRLPTEAEWLAVARPSAELRFPWGDQCSVATCHCPLKGSAGTAPAGHHEAGRSVDGLLDLFGNVWEWTDAGTAPTAGPARVYGASFKQRCTLPDGVIPVSEVNPRAEYGWLGFRLARDLTP